MVKQRSTYFSPEANHNVEKEDIMMADKPNNKETIENAKKVAGKNYEVSDYKSEEQLNKGLAMTHEQVSDAIWKEQLTGK